MTMVIIQNLITPLTTLRRTGLPLPNAMKTPAASAPLLSTDAARAKRRHQTYSRFVHWVRKTHGWIGLWGALLGLVFGLSGIWLNHRTVLKLPLNQQKSHAQMALADPPPSTPEAMGQWLAPALGLSGPPNSVRIDPAKALPWAEKNSDAPRQPERWVFNFGGPSETVQVEYWKGNRSVGINTTQHGFIAALTNLHKGTGMTVPWILLVDTIAGSMVFLSISGVILWVQMNRRRALGVGIFSASVLTALGMVLTRL